MFSRERLAVNAITGGLLLGLRRKAIDLSRKALEN